MINVQLACQKSHFEHRSGNISNLDQNVDHGQPNVSPEEEEIQNSDFQHESTKHPSEAPEEDDRKQAARRVKKEPEDEALSWAQEVVEF